MMRARSRGVAQGAVLAVAASVFALVAADSIFRWYEAHYLVDEIRIDGSRFDLTRFGHNDEIGYIDRERPPGELRILSFGDSFTVSPTVSRLAYSAVLGRELARRLPDRTVRVVNLGQPRTSFDDYLRAIRFWSARLELDAVLVNLYTGNDFRETPPFDGGRARGSPPVVGEARETLRVGPGEQIPRVTPLRMLDYALARFRARGLRATADAQYRPGMLWDEPDHYARLQARMLPVFRPGGLAAYADAQEWLVRLLAELHRLRAGGVAVAVSIAPPDFVVSPEWRARVLEVAGVDAAEVDPDLPASFVQGLTERVDPEIPVIDLRPCLARAEAGGERVYYGTNTHWSVSGNAVVGRVLADVLGTAWLGLPPREPLACPTRPPEPKPPLSAALDALLGGDAATRR